MEVNEILIDCPEIGKDKIVVMVKEKEAYHFSNTLTEAITYTINKRGCSPFIVNGITGNIDANGSFVFNPETDGEYTINFSSSNKKQTFIVTHYPTIIKSVIKNTRVALCNCKCDDCYSSSCLKYQTLFSETQLLFGLLKVVENSESKDTIKLFISLAIDLYKCDLFSLFCDNQLELKLKGSADFSNTLTKKLIAINYLALYFYELWITNPLEEFVKFHEQKYKFKYIKDCVLKVGIDIFALQTIWDQITVVDDTVDPVCSVGCIRNTTTPDLIISTFEVNTQLNGTYHTVTLKNTCFEDAMFIDRLIFSDSTFKVEVRNTSGDNPVTLLPGETVAVNIKFIGTRSISTIIRVPFRYRGSLINTYEIRFVQPEQPNRPPVIVDIFKELDNRDPYHFEVDDFENYFTDPDGDTMDKIVLTGDTTRFTLQGQPYVSGTAISRSNITSLIYTPLDTDDLYQLTLQWMAYDSYGLPSN